MLRGFGVWFRDTLLFHQLLATENWKEVIFAVGNNNTKMKVEGVRGMDFEMQRVMKNRTTCTSWRSNHWQSIFLAFARYSVTRLFSRSLWRIFPRTYIHLRCNTVVHRVEQISKLSIFWVNLWLIEKWYLLSNINLLPARREILCGFHLAFATVTSWSTRGFMHARWTSLATKILPSSCTARQPSCFKEKR